MVLRKGFSRSAVRIQVFPGIQARYTCRSPASHRTTAPDLVEVQAILHSGG